MSDSFSRPDVLGVDIGGVIIDRVSEDDRRDPAGLRSEADAVEVEGALEGIARLVRERFGERVWLVSRCSEPREAVLMTWLERRRFFAATGIPASHVRFCRERRDKAPICRGLGVTHFVDDRLEVLGHLVGTAPHLYHLPSRARDLSRFRHVLPHVRPVGRWSELVETVLAGP